MRGQFITDFIVSATASKVSAAKEVLTATPALETETLLKWMSTSIWVFVGLNLLALCFFIVAMLEPQLSQVRLHLQKWNAARRERKEKEKEAQQLKELEKLAAAPAASATHKTSAEVSVLPPTSGPVDGLAPPPPTDDIPLPPMEDLSTQTAMASEAPPPPPPPPPESEPTEVTAIPPEMKASAELAKPAEAPPTAEVAPVTDAAAVEASTPEVEAPAATTSEPERSALELVCVQLDEALKTTALPPYRYDPSSSGSQVQSSAHFILKKVTPTSNAQTEELDRALGTIDLPMQEFEALVASEAPSVEIETQLMEFTAALDEALGTTTEPGGADQKIEVVAKQVDIEKDFSESLPAPPKFDETREDVTEVLEKKPLESALAGASLATFDETVTEILNLAPSETDSKEVPIFDPSTIELELNSELSGNRGNSK